MTWGAVAVGGASLVAGLMQDNNAPTSGYKPGGFTSTGLNATPSGNITQLTQTPQMQDWLSNVSGAYGKQGQDLTGMLKEVTPAFGKLTQTAQAAIENQRLKTVGNLQDNLARRRVKGSSFGSDALARMNAEFSQKSAEIGTQSKLAEIEASTKLINEITQAYANEFNTYISQANFEAGLGAQIASGVTSALAGNAQMASQINAQRSSDLLNIAGTFGGMGMYNLMSQPSTTSSIGGSIGGSIG
jgi:hypothetical protein